MYYSWFLRLQRRAYVRTNFYENDTLAVFVPYVCAGSYDFFLQVFCDSLGMQTAPGGAMGFCLPAKLSIRQPPFYPSEKQVRRLVTGQNVSFVHDEAEIRQCRETLLKEWQYHPFKMDPC